MKNALTLAALVLSSASGAALAGDWQHTRLTSEEGVNVKLDYVIAQQEFNGCYKCTYYSYTRPL